MQNFFSTKRSKWVCGPRSLLFHVYRGSFPEINGRSLILAIHLHPAPKLRMSRAISPLPLSAFLAWIVQLCLSFPRSTSKRLEFIQIFPTKFLEATSQTWNCRVFLYVCTTRQYLKHVFTVNTIFSVMWNGIWTDNAFKPNSQSCFTLMCQQQENMKEKWNLKIKTVLSWRTSCEQTNFLSSTHPRWVTIRVILTPDLHISWD